MKLRHMPISGLCLALVYLLVNRNIHITEHIKDIDWLNSIYLIATRVVSFFLIGKLLLCFNKIRTGVYAYIFLFLASIFLSTVVMGGDLRRCFSMIYPILATNALILLYVRKEYAFCCLINAISGLYLLLAVINFVLMVVYPQMYGDNYFLGGENHIGHTLLMGLLYNYLYSYVISDSRRLLYYVIVLVPTLLMVWSGATLLGFAFLAFSIFFPFAKKVIGRTPLLLCVSIYGYIFFTVVTLATTGMLENGYIQYVVEDVLGKDMTFSGRVFIWVVVLSGILDSPLLGHGMRDTGDLFTIYVPMPNRPPYQGTFSAHNQILQFLYEGGFLSLIFVLLCVSKVSKLLKDCTDIKLASFFKCVLIAWLIMVMGEAPGFNVLTETLMLASIAPVFIDLKK